MDSLDTAILLHRDEDLWEYLLVAHPSSEVIQKIVAEKKLLEEKFEQDSDRRFYPHITIANFLAKEAMEETFIRWIQNICNLQKSFTVTLNNYSAFPNSGLYLRVQHAEPFIKLGAALKILDGFMHSNDCPSVHLVSKPHLTFVKGLSEYSYKAVVDEYSRKTFHESFKVEKLILLKKDHSKSHHINTFILPPPLTLFE